jgi:hypothetical protein
MPFLKIKVLKGIFMFKHTPYSSRLLLMLLVLQTAQLSLNIYAMQGETENVAAAQPTAEEIAAARLTAEEINDIEADCALMDEEAPALLAEINELRAEILDPVLMHQATHPREVWLEKIEQFNTTPVYTFENLRAPVLDFNDPQGVRQARVCINAQDIAEPLFYASNLLFDIHSIKSYFNSVIEIIVDAIIRKEDVVLYNVNLLATAHAEESKLSSIKSNIIKQALENLQDIIEKTIAQNDKFKQLSINYFKNRIPTTLLAYTQKLVRTPPFIMSRTPRRRVNPAINHPARPIGANQPPVDNIDAELVDALGLDNGMFDFHEDANIQEADRPAVSITNQIYYRLFAKPFFYMTRKSFERVVNEKITGYKYINQNSLIRRGWISYTSTIADFLGGACDLLLEAAKQSGSAGTFDESFWFTASTEIIFNSWFFYRTVNSSIKKQLIEMFTTNFTELETVIQAFEKRLASPKNASQERQAAIRDAFKNEISEIVKNNFSPLQPILVEKLRDGHLHFNYLTTAALLAPAAYSVGKMLTPLIKTLRDF